MRLDHVLAPRGVSSCTRPGPSACRAPTTSGCWPCWSSAECVRHGVEQGHDAVRAVHHQVGRRASSVTSAEPLNTVSPGTPSLRSVRTVSKAATSPRSSPQNMTADGVVFSAHKGPQGLALIHALRPQLDHHPPGSTASPCRAARPDSGSRSRSRVACGSAVCRVCTATAWPLSSIRVPSGAAAVASRPGSSVRAACTPAVARGELFVSPALEAVVAQHDEVRDGLEPAQLHRGRGRAAGDHRQRVDRGGHPAQGRTASGCARASPGSATIGDSVSSKSSATRAGPIAEQRRQPARPSG